MNPKNINRANQIQEELNDLNYFLENINSRWKQTKMILKIKNKISYSVFGSRWFGADTHEMEIKIPESVMPKLEAEAYMIKKELIQELKSL